MSLLDLAELQRQFVDAIYQFPQHSSSVDTTTLLLLSTSQLSASRRLAIYRGSIFENLTQALQQSYPLCCKLLGAPQFRDLARLYLLGQPSRTQNLNSYGGDFADFLARRLASKELTDAWAALPDLARLEWAWDQVYYAADAPQFAWQALQQLDEKRQEQIVLKLSPNARLLESNYALHDFWKSHHQRLPLSTNTLPSAPQGESLIIWRRGFERAVRVLSPLQSGFLHAVLAGKQLGEVFGSLGEPLPSEAAQLFAESVEQSWVVEFTVGID